MHSVHIHTGVELVTSLSTLLKLSNPTHPIPLITVVQLSYTFKGGTRAQHLQLITVSVLG